MLFSLRELLDKAIKRSGSADRILEAQVKIIFKEIVSEITQVSPKTITPLFIKGKELIVKIDNPLLASQIKLKEKEIINRLHQKLGRKAIKGLRTIIG